MHHHSNDRNHKTFRQIAGNQPSAAPAGSLTPPGSPGPSSGQLAQIAASLTQGGGLADLHCPKAQREARRRFRKAELEHVTQVAISEIRSVAEVKHQEIALRAAQQRAELVTAENASLGQLEREQQQLAYTEMGDTIQGDTRRQQHVRAADLLPEDRELLERMNHFRAEQRVKEISREHGVRFPGDPQPPGGPAEHDLEDDSY